MTANDLPSYDDIVGSSEGTTEHRDVRVETIRFNTELSLTYFTYIYILYFRTIHITFKLLMDTIGWLQTLPNGKYSSDPSSIVRQISMLGLLIPELIHCCY